MHYEKGLLESRIRQLVSKQPVQMLLEKHGRTSEFLIDLMQRFSRIENQKAIQNIADLANLQFVLEIYARDNWTEEDKFIASSNFLQYGMK